MSKKRKPVLDSLKPDEAKAVLVDLLAVHPNLGDEAEKIAKSIVSDISFEAIAEEVSNALRTLDLDDLNDRAGRHSWGYKEPNEAAWELLEEEVEPFREEMNRHLTLGLQKEALEVCKGILLGLYRARQEKEGEVLGWASDFPEETAGYILEEWKKGKRKMTFPQDFMNEFIPDWADIIKRLSLFS